MGHEDYVAYVGTYTSGESKGLYAFRPEGNGNLVQKGCPAYIDNPSYINIDKNKGFLYAVIENDAFHGEHGGGVAAFKIDCKSGALDHLSAKGTKGASPCHLTTDREGKRLFVANYAEGTFTIFDISDEGKIGEIRSVVVHEGSGINADRQEKAHVHCVVLTPDEKFLLAVDLGMDKIIIYSVFAEEMKPEGEYQARPGSGPRHVEFHPGERYLYLLNELSSDIDVLRYDENGVTLEKVQTISTLPKDFIGYNICAAIHISKDGRFLYASNRGHDSISAFKVDKATGMLDLKSVTPCGGEFPRDFQIDPSGEFLYSANQNSSTITAFRIDREYGLLTPLDHVIKVPNPTCIKFYEIKP